MMMTAQLSSPKLAAQMTALSVKHPSLSTLKLKLSTEDETSSPTSLDELAADNSGSSADESSVISPKKKIKAEGPATISAAMTKWEADVKDEPLPQSLAASSAPVTPSSAYVPFAFNLAPAVALDDEELQILNYFLA